MKQFMDKFTTVSDLVCKIFAYVSMVAIVFLMGAICVDAVTTNLKVPLPGMYELCQMILTTVVFTTWAYTQSMHGHIHVTMFVSRMPQKLRFLCFGITSLISTVVMGIASYAVYLQIFKKKASGEQTGTLLIPHWPFYIFETIAFVLLTILLLRDTIKAFMAMGSKEMAEEIQATW